MSKKNPLSGKLGTPSPSKATQLPATSGNTSASAAAGHQNNSSGGKKRQKAVLLGIIILLVFVLAFIIGFFTIRHLLDSGSAQTSQTAQTSQSAQSQTPAQNQQSSQPADEGAAAPAHTDPRAIQLIKELQRNDKNDPRAMGNPDAPVIMMEFADFSCPVCSYFDTNVLPQLMPYVDKGILRIEFHNFNIFADRYHSDLGARGAIAAGYQGKFWQFGEASAELSKKENNNHPDWTEQRVMEVAKAAGVKDLAKFKQDFDAPATIKLVQKETDQAQQAGFGGTPAFLINNRFISGVPSMKTFVDTIQAAEKDATKK